MGMRIAADPPPSSPMNMGCSSLTPWRPPPRRCSFPPTRSFRSRMRRRTAGPPHPARDTPTDIRRPGARILVDDRKERAFASRLIRCKTKGRNAPKTGHSKRACNRLPLARKTTTAESPHARSTSCSYSSGRFGKFEFGAGNRIQVRARQSRVTKCQLFNRFPDAQTQFSWVTQSEHRELPRKLPRFCAAGGELCRSLANVIPD